MPSTYRTTFVAFLVLTVNVTGTFSFTRLGFMVKLTTSGLLTTVVVSVIVYALNFSPAVVPL